MVGENCAGGTVGSAIIVNAIGSPNNMSGTGNPSGPIAYYAMAMGASDGHIAEVKENHVGGVSGEVAGGDADIAIPN